MKHAGEFDAIDRTFNKINDTLKKAKEGDNGALIWCVEALSHEVRELARKVATIPNP